MSDVKLGEIIKAGLSRDAIHCAVIPVMASEGINPGDHVGIRRGTDISSRDNPIGIVDPFIRRRVLRGEWFYLILYPGTTINLRHEWDHPMITSQAEREVEKPRGRVVTPGWDDDEGRCAC